MKSNMMKDLRSILSALCEVQSIPGYEDRLFPLVSESYQRLDCETLYSGVNGILARKKSAVTNEKTVRVLLCAHLDQTGFLVSGYGKKSLLKLTPVGISPKKLLPGSRMKVLKNDGSAADGVVPCVSPHVKNYMGNDKIDYYVVDVGSDAGIKEKFGIGNMVTFAGNVLSLGRDTLAAPGCGARATVAAMLAAAELMKNRNVELYLAGTAGGVLGRFGAAAMAELCKPDVLLVLENSSEENHAFLAKELCGNGPVIGINYASAPCVARELMAAAEREGIAYGKEHLNATYKTQAHTAQTAGCGYRTAVLTIPADNVGSGNETVRFSDVEKTARLLAAYMNALEVGAAQ